MLSALTRRYFEDPPAVGVLAGARIARGDAGRVEEGAWVQFDFECAADGLRIEQARFLAFGCPHLIAVAAWVAEQAPGRALAAGLPEPVPALRARFEVPVEKTGRLLLIEDAWQAAVRAAIADGDLCPHLP
jgi:hypothetical protein